MLRQELRNLLQSLALMAGMVGLLLLLGWLFAGWFGMLWVLLVGIIPLFVSVRLFPTLILKMYRARPIPFDEAPQLHAIVGELGRRAGLAEPPSLHYIPSSVPLIFSIGQGKNAAIALADGILRLLSLRELVGVLGHEVSHLRHNDTWVMSLADVVSRITRAISLLGQFLVLVNLPLFLLGSESLPWVPILLMMLAPTISAFLQLSLSRTREYDADLYGAQISGDPAGLGSALVKLEEYQRRTVGRKFIPGRGSGEPSILRTHPVTEERIRRLRDVEKEMYPGEETIFRDENGHLRLPPHMAEVSRKPRRRLTGLWH